MPSAKLYARPGDRSVMRTVSTGTKLLWVTVALVAVLGSYLVWAWNRPLHPGEENYVVKPGTGVSALATELHRRGTMLESRSFVLLGRITVPRREFKAGEYRFRDGISARELLAQVAAGRVAEYPLRLVEGWTFQQVLQNLTRAPHLTQTLKGMSYSTIMARVGAPGLHPEGRFYPDTYFYSKGNSDFMILQRAYDRMRARLRQEWENRDADLPLKSPEEALILASIVEKETGRTEERRLIAGVFINRLKKNIRLQTDPTVIYGLGAKFDGNLRKRDLLSDTPYNTYTRRGLPPTPIAMPSGDSLYAVLHPERTRALYFVSRGDGTHVFSDTLEEHDRAVTQYQLGGRSPTIPSRGGTQKTPKAR